MKQIMPIVAVVFLVLAIGAAGCVSNSSTSSPSPQASASATASATTAKTTVKSTATPTSTPTSRPTSTPRVFTSVTPTPVTPAAGPCNCNGPDLNCANFATQAQAQACYDYCKAQGKGDVFRLDADKDGIACESNA